MWEFFVSYGWVWLLAAVDLSLALAVTAHAVLWKRDSRAVIAWVGLAWLAPILGAIAYFCFGVNRIHRKAVSLRLRDSWQDPREPQLTEEDIDRRDRFVDQHRNLIGLAVLGNSLTGKSVSPGNRIRPLTNGDEAFPAMIGAINRAEKTVSLLSYIFDSDRPGNAFKDALLAAQQRGVDVRILIDDIGSKYSRPNMVRQLQQSGLTAASFLPTRLPRLPKYANMRNHRKILTIDGQIGFTGGTNIREGHCLDLNPKFPVQCLHFELQGPVVAHLQEAFVTDWAFVTGESLTTSDWFPQVDRAGSVWARGVTHGPDEDFEKMSDLILGALSVARSRVNIVTPYFLPDGSLIKALTNAAMRGVEVNIYLPEKNNILLVQWATTAQLWQTLEKGCRVNYMPPPFDHTKVMTVDGVWSLIGSTNWDPRSLRLNFEFNVECYDDALADELDRIVAAKAKSAREVTLDEVNGRSLPVRLRDGLARLFSPYL